MSTDDDFLAQLRATFQAEAQEHLQVMGECLLALERSPAPQQLGGLIESLFRAAHSLKGAARAVEYESIESECQSAEEVLSEWRSARMAPPPASLKAMHDAVGRISSLLEREGVAAVAAEGPGAYLPPSAAHAGPADHGAMPAAAPAAPGYGATVRVTTEVLDEQLVQAEELLTTKVAHAQLGQELRSLVRELENLPRMTDPRDGALDAVRVSELAHVVERLRELTRTAEGGRDQVSRLVDDLLGRARRLLMLPFTTVSGGLGRMLRDLAEGEGKEVELVTTGETVEVDKRVLESLRDPLLHLLRNAVAHGIEPPAERLLRGKPQRGRIELGVRHLSGNLVSIRVADDGAGIDPARIRKVAVERGLITEQEAGALDDAQAQQLIFRSGFSTSPAVSRLAGRGLGMAIVQEKVNALAGQLRLASVPGRGTTVEMHVPAVHASFCGVVVRCAGQHLVLPTLHLEKVLRVPPKDLRAPDGRSSLHLDGRVLRVERLDELLELPPTASPAGDPHLVVLRCGELRAGLVVDEVVEEQEFAVKPLRPPLVRVRHVEACVSLPDGQLALVLNPSELLASALRHTPAAVAPRPAVAAAAAPMVLVVEDSITSRMLLKATLEASGFRVMTAVDGMDALAKLRSHKVALVVSDVEMPRLDGFELTKRIRAMQATSRLPVVLVTTLDSPTHGVRGVDAGASAYIVKSGFDQGRLVETVRRLL